MLVPALLLAAILGLGLALAASSNDDQDQGVLGDHRFWAGVLAGVLGLAIVAGLAAVTGMALTDMGGMDGSGPADDGHDGHDHARAERIVTEERPRDPPDVADELEMPPAIHTALERG